MGNVTRQSHVGSAVSENLRAILKESSLTKAALAHLIGTSLVSVTRWERGDCRPNIDMSRHIHTLLDQVRAGAIPRCEDANHLQTFASRGIRNGTSALPLFPGTAAVSLAPTPGATITSRLKNGSFWQAGAEILRAMQKEHAVESSTPDQPFAETISAGKNTYTYDAHTYHTKVPPQGIAEVLRYYLPDGGIVLDPFAGSGMTGVAALTQGYDVVLNELSPAASFIANRFTSQIDPAKFSSAISAVCRELSSLRKALYTTVCRECSKPTEILFTVWSYRVKCYLCGHEFLLWDYCRRYGKDVREHKILSDFDCPSCKHALRKPRLKRTIAEPVLLGYKCCSRTQVEHPLTDADRKRLQDIEDKPPVANGFYPTTILPDGVNLSQPKRHGLTSIDRFYTPRNLSAMSHLWQTIHRLTDPEVVGFAAFVFTSLYQRVTRLSEFRFWGGSGNTAHFNVPFIFNEANVFVTFERKARSIRDHLETTAHCYRARSVVRTGSATDMSFLPDNSIDLVFTDPPFGANINYSEMNVLWESWLGEFTDSANEAIINKHQKKDVSAYEMLMRQSLSECCRVLRPGHWLILVFMNSSRDVWQALRHALIKSGFQLERLEIFDKQHGTFKQFVSENTAGCDLVLHCRKPNPGETPRERRPTGDVTASITRFFSARQARVPTLSYLHVDREDDVDYRMLYSQWLSECLLNADDVADFASFRKVAQEWLERTNA